MNGALSLHQLYNSLPEEYRRKKNDDEIRDLCSKWQSDKNTAARDIVVASFMPLCIKISATFSKNYKFSSEIQRDLEQTMTQNLMETIDRFDPRKNNLFYTYAAKRLDGAAKDFVKARFELNSSIEKYLFFNVKKLKAQIKAENPSITATDLLQEIADRTYEKTHGHCTAADVVDIEKFVNTVASGKYLSEDLTDGEGAINLYDGYETRPDQILLDLEDQALKNSFVTKASEALSPIGWYIIEQNILKDTPVDLKILSRKLGIPLDTVKRTLDESLEKLKDIFTDHENDFSLTKSFETAIPEHERPKAKLTYHSYKTNILTSAFLHKEQTGSWPHKGSGIITTGALKGKNWATVDHDIENGKIALQSDARSLSELLTPYKLIENLTLDDILFDEPMLNQNTLHIEDILKAAQQYFDATCRWPNCNDFEIIRTGVLEGETWGRIDKALRDGLRGLPGGSSLSKLLIENGIGNAMNANDVLEGAKLHHKTYGSWPSSSDTTPIKIGKLKGKNWKAIDTAFHRGYFELPTGTTLSQFLRSHGCHDDNTLHAEDIIAAAKQHKQQTGKWPSCKDNAVIKEGALKGEKWTTIHTALRDGYRELPKIEGGLPGFLKENNCVDRPATQYDVLQSAFNYRNAHPQNKWPNNKTTERISDNTILSGSTWASIDKRKINGMSINQIIKDYEAAPEKYLPHLQNNRLNQIFESINRQLQNYTPDHNQTDADHEQSWRNEPHHI